MANSESFYSRLENATRNVGNPNVKDWFMMTTPLPPIVLTILYILFVTKIGPMLMKNRKPFQLKTTLIIYNLFQVLACSYIVYKMSVSGWTTHYKFYCQPLDYSADPDSVSMATCVWLYHLMKIVEFLDTIFFVLRKKSNQITVLHVFHHSYVAIVSWIWVKFASTGSLTFSGYLNSLMHIIMYGYYLLAALGPHMQKYLWWKKYITMLQLVQFVIILIHGVPHFFMKDCEFSRVVLGIESAGVMAFVIMFSNFYRMQYVNQKRQPSKTAALDKAKTG